MKTKALLPRYHFFWNGIPFPLWAVTGRPSGASKWFTPAARGREAASRPTPFHHPASLFGCAWGGHARSSRLQNIIAKVGRFVKRKFSAPPGAWGEGRRSRSGRRLRAGCQTARDRRAPAPHPSRCEAPGRARPRPGCARPGRGAQAAPRKSPFPFLRRKGAGGGPAA